MNRPLRKSDIPRLREIHRQANYGFEFPDLETSEIGLVIEEAGEVVGWVGAELEAQIIGIFSPTWGSPHMRMRTFASLHLPIAEELEKRNVKSAYVALDPQFKKFGRRLSQLGWKQALWTQFFMSVKECIRALRTEVCHFERK